MFRAGLLLIIRRIDSVYKAIGIVMRCVDWLLAAASQHLHKIITPCSLKFQNIVTYVLKIFLFGIICGSFQFIPQHPVVLPAFFSVDTLPFPSFIRFTDHFLCNPWFSCSLLDFPNQITDSI